MEHKKAKLISLDEFRKKKKPVKFDVIKFAQEKLLQDNPKNIKYL